MLTKESIANKLACYYLIQNSDKRPDIDYVFMFTKKLSISLNLSIPLHLLVDKVELSEFDIIIRVTNKYQSIASSSFCLLHKCTIHEPTDIEPLNILRQLVGEYGFDTGREIDDTYNLIIDKGIFCGKNSPREFIKYFYDNRNKLRELDKDFTHVVELPAKDEQQFTLYLYYIASEFKKSDKVKLILTAYLNEMNVSDKYLGSSVLDFDVVPFVNEHGIDNIDTLLLLTILDRPWEIIAEEALKYAVKIISIDTALSAL